MPSNFQKKASDKLVPAVDNPEALIRAKNAERRHLAKLAKSASSNQEATEPTQSPPTADTTTPSEVPSPFLSAMQPSELPYTPGAFSSAGGSTPKDGPAAGTSTLPTIPKPEEQSTAELVRLLLAAQHASSVQSLAD